ncbi:FAD-dependent oxidoreductase [Xylanimonas allomyrinae]|uniref:FAD-dependent oxidoreductase n=1 Tax=Xylanimonas allomyrinae TaxID=2509459 RepID=A0A4V0YDY0_9MICO|nr:FAD-dependent oxidoreductase [Xylanimonas allomyrinae]QAY62281.1 FAD-dependent oxidoreductase [Xylanimonas allomyrinae]
MERVVVAGAGLAGLRAVQAARKAGFAGRLTLVGAEPHLPYDRPPLSKEFLTGPPLTPTLGGAQGLAEDLGVEVLLGTPASALDTEARVLSAEGREVPYDALVIATGALARTLPGAAHLRGVHTLRTLDDARAVRARLDAGARTVVVGAGFIGSELASAARARGLDATVLESLPTPLTRAVGATAGAALGALHARHGTDLCCAVTVTGLEGETDVTGVRLSDGSVVAADLVVVGIGATPATGWLAGSGLRVDDGVVCDATLAGAPGVWAAGDVARWPHPDLGVSMRLEHWTNASEQAGHAMRNALDPGAAQPYRHVPYFWSDWYGDRIQFVGVPHGEPALVAGAWDEPCFVALYRRDARVVGALTLNRRADIMKYRALIARGASWQDGLDLAERRRVQAV